MRTKLTLMLLLITNSLCASTPPPRLIVQLVVDQLRGDLIEQYRHEWGTDGFNYLLTHGLDFQNAHHPHAYTTTCIGHATIATGSTPSLHGIIGNDWFVRENLRETYCVEDLKSPILPTSRSKLPLSGRSPNNLMVSTLSDELVLAKKGRAFGVSLKDRAAITLAGHAGKAFWFDKENGGFISSQHYYSTYPSWVTAWNQQYQPKRETWELSKPLSTYHYATAPRFKNNYPLFGSSFPHDTGAPGSVQYYKLLSMTPNADELTADFARQLLIHEKLGTSSQQTDYLAISFSAVDAIGHQFGPNSLESEDNLLRLDKTLAQLLKTIDREVGLQNTLIVLTADHGVADSPAFLNAHHVHQEPELQPAALQKILVATLAKQFNLPEKTLQAIKLPYVYLDQQLIAERHLSLNKVVERLITPINQQTGVFQAYSLPLRNRPLNWLSTKVDNMAFPHRSGDIYIVSPPYQFSSDQLVRVNHGTPWRYDTYVPLLFVNPGFPSQRISKPVQTTDIASTLAAILQITEPSAATGHPLLEVMAHYE